MKTNVDLDLIDVGGNTGSVMRSFERLNVSYRRVDANQQPDGSRPIILPGVGAFGAVMKQLEANGFKQQISRCIAAGTPFLGICVGMQVLFESSEESPGIEGLGVLPGSVVRFDNPKVPQIGWNYIEAQRADWQSGYVYFVNSYFARPDDGSVVLFSSNYSGRFCAAVQRDNVTAFQFHPEKSGPFGEALLRNWLASAGIKLSAAVPELNSAAEAVEQCC
jgi:imidazole glycerol-phosphate synthase subunit HisH